MRRRAIRIFLFVLLGAIVNVAVAWGCALTVHLERGTVEPDDFYLSAAHGGHWEFWFLSSSGVRRMTAGYALGTLPAQRVHPEYIPPWSRAAQEADNVAVSMLIAEDACGWPMFSCCCLYELELAPGDVFAATLRWGIEIDGVHGPGKPPPRSAGGIRLRADYIYARALPLRPIWPGFAINTVFYAVVLWLLFAGPFVVRRWRRIRRGLCPKCAYDLRGTPSEACPECGAAANLDRPERRR